MRTIVAERRQYEGFLRREEANVGIRALADDGTLIREIARRTGHSRQTVRQVVRGGGVRTDAFRTRMSSLEPYLAQLDADCVRAATTQRSCGGVSTPKVLAAVCGPSV